MAGTAKAYNTNLVELGPGDVWIAVAVPGAAARMTLHTDGTPESVANPSCKHLGMTLEGAKLIYTPSLTTFESDEQTAPIITTLGGEEAKIEGAALQVLDMALMTYLMTGATFSSAAGYEENSFGGKQTVATYTVAYIAPVYADPTKFFVVQLYKAYNAAGISMDVSRKKMATIPFSFTALSVGTRAAGDQIGAFWKSLT